MSVKKIVRIVCALSLTAAACVLPVFSGCSIKTKHPQAKITITFDGTDYELNYKMYRNMYPQTVQHFIELSDNGFYDNTVIHNYSTSSYWYGGGYSYSESYKSDFADNGMAEYLENNSKELAYEQLFDEGKLTPSVYRNYVNGSYTDALSTLIGEFTNNKHVIDNGALVSSYGCLRMYYSSKDTNEVIYTKKDGNTDKQLLGQYKYNSATSLFSIQISDSTSSDASYCIFAELTNTDVLTDLQTAISDYITASAYTTSTFTKSATVYIDNYDEIIGQRVNEGTFSLTAEPLIVKSVDITKY